MADRRLSRMRRLAAVAALCLGAALALVGGLAASAPASADAAPGPTLTASAAIVIEASTGQSLYGVGAQRRLPVASTTKLMTALLTLERARLGSVFAAPDYHPAPSESQIGLVPGERMSVHDLLLALLLPSANDAAEDLAFNLGHGSVGRFVEMMNARARELGLVHTHYTTPIGLDTPGNYSSASDLVKLAVFLLERQAYFAHVVALPRAILRTGAHPRVLTNRNDLIGRVGWVNGVKTGHTLAAGYVMVGSGARGGMTLVSAVLGTPSQSARDADTLALLGYGFAHFHLATPVRAGTVLARPTVRDQPGVHPQVLAGRTFTTVVSRSTKLSTRVVVSPQLTGPLPPHAVVGHVLVLANGRPIATIPLLLAARLAAVSPLTLVGRFLTRPSTLVVLVALVAAAIALALLRRERARARDSVRPQAA